MFCSSCRYALFFDTHSAERKSHPFAFTSAPEIPVGTKIVSFDFVMTFFGNSGIEYIPLVMQVLKKAGAEGMFKSRTSFTVSQALDSGEILSDACSSGAFTPLVWQFPEDDGMQNQWHGSVLVQLKTPLRLLTDGRYTDAFDVFDFMRAMWRRAIILCKYYGEYNDDEYDCKKISYIIEEKNTFWKDSVHYSARQQRKVMLKGLCGSLRLSGVFTEQDLAVLELNHIANAGKNTVFGLGQLECWKNLKKIE